jgi:hypothetical protein
MTEQAHTDSTGCRSQSGYKRLLDTLEAFFSKLTTAGNKRQFIIRNKHDQTVLRLPLTVAAIIGLFLIWQALPLVVVTFIVALFLKMQFVVAVDTPAARTPEATP